MLDNIYKYSSENEYETGIFFIGAGHRKSIIIKIINHICTTSNLIKWECYNYDKIWE